MVLLGPYAAYGVGDHVPLARIISEHNVNIDKSLGIGERKRPPELRFEHAENGGVGANAEGEREDDDEREAGILAKDASGIAKIAQKCFDEGQPFSFAPGFFGLFEAAEFDEGMAAGLLGRHARAKVVFDVKLEMAFHFSGELALSSGLAKQSGESDEPRT